jgi:surfeit locus 1 family protein
MDRSRRRRVPIVAIAAIVAVTCLSLGFWQLQRLAERRTRNAEIEREWSRDPVLITAGVGREGLQPYTPVRAHGIFDPEREVLIYGRSLGGEPGHLVVTPLIFDDGTGVLVDRGWVPFDHQTVPVADAAPPTGELTIRGFVVPDEGDGSTVPDPNRVVGRLDVQGIASSLPYRILPRAIQLTRLPRSPQPSGLPVPLPPEELSEGPHLSYAIQWFAFAAIAVAGAVVLVRRERRSTTGAP